jgi:hypothetical protein
LGQSLRPPTMISSTLTAVLRGGSSRK